MLKIDCVQQENQIVHNIQQKVDIVIANPVVRFCSFQLNLLVNVFYSENDIFSSKMDITVTLLCVKSLTLTGKHCDLFETDIK